MSTSAGSVIKVAITAAVAVLAVAGCGGSAESEGEASEAAAAAPSEAAEASEAAPAEAGSEAPSSAADADVTVLLSEWIVEPTPTSVGADGVTFLADNQGGDTHEMVVVRADDPTDLPTDEDGAVDESQIPEGDFIGEIEEFPSGEQRTGTFDLEPGTYVLFCNITEIEDDGEVESHFAEGMSTTFTVE